MEIKTIGVAGAGTMGGGIAQVVAQAGFEVFLLDISDALVEGSVERIEKGLAKNVDRGKLSSGEMGEILKRIHPTTQVEDFRNANLVIEAVFEDFKFKTELLLLKDNINAA